MYVDSLFKRNIKKSVRLVIYKDRSLLARRPANATRHPQFGSLHKLQAKQLLDCNHFIVLVTINLRVETLDAVDFHNLLYCPYNCLKLDKTQLSRS